MASETPIYLSQSASSSSKPSIIKETDKDVLFKACLQEGDLLNRNKKIYPAAVVEAALREEHIQTQLRTGTWFGEANHPLAPKVERQLWLNPELVSHSICSVERKGSNFYGEILSARSKLGDFMKGCVDQDKILSFSMRGIHHLERVDRHFVVKNLKIFTYDWVPYPSNYGATMVNASEGTDLIKSILNQRDDVEDVEVQVDRRDIEQALASEGGNSFAMVEDLLEGTPDSVSVTPSGVIARKGPSVIGFKTRRAFTESILREVLR
jgi:hypothetical protein